MDYIEEVITAEDALKLKVGEVIYLGDDSYTVVETGDHNFERVTIQDDRFSSRACLRYEDFKHYGYTRKVPKGQSAAKEAEPVKLYGVVMFKTADAPVVKSELYKTIPKAAAAAREWADAFAAKNGGKVSAQRNAVGYVVMSGADIMYFQTVVYTVKD